MIRFKLGTRRRDAENFARKYSSQFWHEKLGNQNKTHVQEILKINGIDVTSSNTLSKAFMEGRHTKSKIKLR